jgi:4-amino-4-deoxy-L-arabinose transferase-like glycosyltransferase
MLVKGGFAQAASPFRQAALSGALLRPAAIMAALTGCAVLVRLPFLSDAGTDESFYLVVARQWLEGMPPYANALDVKPPLLFALMAGAEALFGPSLLAAKALTMAAVSATACALYLFGRRFIGELSGVAASLFYIAASLTLSGALSPAELIMAPFTAFGMLAGFAGLAKERPRLWPLAGAGVLFGAAACVKQTAIFEALPLAAFLVLRRPPDDAFKALASFALGCIVVPAGFGLFFLAEGHFGALFDNVVMSVAGRMSAGYVSWSEAFVRFGHRTHARVAPRDPGDGGMVLPRRASRGDSPPRRPLSGGLGGRGAGRCARGESDVRLLHVGRASPFLSPVGRVPGAWDRALSRKKDAPARAGGGIRQRHDFFCDRNVLPVLRHGR